LIKWHRNDYKVFPGRGSKSRQRMGRAFFSFANYVSGFLITADSRKARVTLSIVRRPFKKLDAHDDERVLRRGPAD